jgi:hypothetical protein
MYPTEDCSIGGKTGITRDMLPERERLVFEWCVHRHVPITFRPREWPPDPALARFALNSSVRRPECLFVMLTGRYRPVLLMEECAKVACTRWIGAPRSKAWLAWGHLLLDPRSRCCRLHYPEYL